MRRFERGLRENGDSEAAEFGNESRVGVVGIKKGKES